jgi:hypothetical protein
MHRIHKIHEQWINGNRKDAINELAKCEGDEVREFMGFLNTQDRGTAMIIALNRVEDFAEDLAAAFDKDLG